MVEAREVFIKGKLTKYEEVAQTIRTTQHRAVPNTIQRVNQMFASSTSTHSSNIANQTPRPTRQNDLLISFETPAPAHTRPVATPAPETLLDLDLDDLFPPTPQSRAQTDQSLTSLVTAAIDSERTKWHHEAEMRHAAEMEALAADLHSQYREKHTRKVEALKLTYKRQYEKKIGGLEERVRTLEGEVKDLEGVVEVERREKGELILMSEELMRLTNNAESVE
jgi:Fungal Transforming acidic coiled-coil (TACC) proteins